MLNSAHRDDWPVLSHDADFTQWTDDVADTQTHRWGVGKSWIWNTITIPKSAIRKDLQALA